MLGNARPALQAGSFLALVFWAVAAAAAAAPAPVHYTLDASRSLLRFAFEQAGANNTGRFGKYTVDVLFSPDNLAASKIDVKVDIASLDTGDKDRDDTLKGIEVAMTHSVQMLMSSIYDLCTSKLKTRPS